MSRYHSYLNSATKLLASYKGTEPFASFARKYFAENKKHGSTDRKQILHLCYCFFRTSHATKHLSADEQIIAGLFLCSSDKNKLLNELKQEWNELANKSLREKLSILQLNIDSLFPWKEELSKDIEFDKYASSFLTQPDLFLRIRPGYTEKVLIKLKEAGLEYEFIAPFSIRLPNNFKIENYFEVNKEVVVQDLNSQSVMEHLPLRKGESTRVWDCCAGSGGKSIMAFDLDPEIDLTVSDIRESIIINLKKRFREAGIKKYTAFNLSASEATQTLRKEFDLIICDAPCTGSGTSGRTPERLAYFDEKEIIAYTNLQKKIVGEIMPMLKKGGHLLYITCSVFSKENEDVVDLITGELQLELVKMELRKGYDKKADTLFSALLRRPL